MTSEQLRLFRKTVKMICDHGPKGVTVWYPYLVTTGLAFGIREDCVEWARLWYAALRCARRRAER